MSDLDAIAAAFDAPIVATQTLHIPVARDTFWKVFGDTARFARLVGEPTWQLSTIDEQEPLTILRGASLADPDHPIHVEIEPHQWVRGRFLAGPRRFRGLPLRSGVMQFALSAAGPQDTRVDVRMSCEAGAPELRGAGEQFCRAYVDRSVRALQTLASRMAAGLADPYAPPPPADAAAIRQHAQRLVAEMAVPADERQALDRLPDYIATSDEALLSRMRPAVLAASWGLSAEATLRAFLHAARAGVLELVWDVLCPSCRGTALRSPRLDGVLTHGHCAACTGVYEVEFDRLVEATFRPARALRPCSDTVFCVPGPSAAPHVEAQVVLTGGQPCTLDLQLAPGSYRIWVQRASIGGTLIVDEDGPDSAQIDLLPPLDAGSPHAAGHAPGPWRLRAGGAQLSICWRGNDRRLVLIEQAAWIPGLTSAAEITSLQEFRDLYPRTAVAAGQRIRVGRMAFLFSDLKGSTAMFERMGDGPAYAQVHDHFELLTECVRTHHGAVIKTIGDAIMAVFPKDADALAAALDIQRRLPAFNRSRPDSEPIIVKLGVHAGPCVVTSANELLDYFGTTVNLAARVQGQSQGGDVVVLSQLLATPDVARIADGVRREEYSATLAGLQSLYPLTRLFP